MRRRRGANAIEFALCMPVFVLIAAGTIDFAWLFYHRSAVDAAIAFGCRDGALIDPLVGYPTTVAELAVIEALENNGLPCEAVGCTSDATITGTMPNVSVRCEIDITFEPLFGLLTGSQHMHAHTVRRLEWQRESSLPPPPEG